MPHDPAVDRRFMTLALSLSRRGLGQTWPNPSVGAVLVREMGGEAVIVGRGLTQAGGRPHGEAMALAQAGDAAAGATLYVALEPCSYSSLRGGVPCVERTLKAGVRRVVSAIEDPNPRIAGLGHALLRTAGIKVDVGVLSNEAARLHRGHFRRVREDLPTVTFKIARTADGYAGGPNRAQVAISCAEATAWVHLQRTHFDAIMLGVGTVLADDPMLNVRLPGLAARSPIRVVLDTRLRMHTGLKLVATCRDIPTWVIAAEDAPVGPEQALVAAGVEVMRVARAADGHLDLREALQLLATRGITRVFSEGGPTVGEQLVLQSLADEVIVSTSPNMLGVMGVTAVRPGLAMRLAAGKHFRLVRERMIGHDLFQFHERIV
ncbi:MAG: bifunctional diaminohydroxyphosphoribosylaminopyrimidine deaminase/5-amino-6-(5-phosphoribosylamino)uracil reductase RibD [Bosea sp. (in: a-proteobacteria)]